MGFLTKYKRNGQVFTRVLGVVILAALAATGCGSGSPGGVSSGILGTDLHGDAAVVATAVVPDGANVRGQINTPGDEDWFTFRGIQGVTYCLQIIGFPPDPTVALSFDLTGDGDRVLIPKIVDFDGATQLINSSGTQGGTSLDIDPAGTIPPSGGATFRRFGDSRVMWVCPNTTDYFFRIVHERNGIGAYEVRLATSQFGTIDFGDTIVQTGVRLVDLPFNMPDDVRFTRDVRGGVGFTFIEIEQAWPVFTFGLFSFVSPVVRLDPPDPETGDPADPEDWLLHFHVGHPNNFFPAESDNLTESDDVAVVHPFFIEVPITVENGPVRAQTTEGVLRTESGDSLRFPVEVETHIEENTLGETGVVATLTFRVDGSVNGSTRGIGQVDTLTAEDLRTIIGFDWYMDIHPVSDMDLDPLPVATSRPQGDIYSFFESELAASPQNVVLRTEESLSDTVRGVPGTFDILYDASLKLFQVASQLFVASTTYDPISSRLVNPAYAPFTGDRVRVHAGGPGQIGPVLIDLGTLPAVQPPPTGVPGFENFTVATQPGFRVPIRQLTDAEATILRNAFYGGGFYVQVSDSVTGAPVARAEGALEISLLPFDNPFRSLQRTEGTGLTSGSVEMGVVNFALTTDRHGLVEVVCNGEGLGALSEVSDADIPPPCGLAGDGRTVASEFYPGRYYWHAHAADGTKWEGFVSVESGACETVFLELK